MYTLYDGARTGGSFVRAVLAETGAAYEVVLIDHRTGAHQQDDYARINPRQQVPALRLADGSILTEGVAIAIHLADCHPDAELLPAIGTGERAQVMRWLLFFAVNVYEGRSRMGHPTRYVGDPACAPAVAAAAAILVNECYAIFEAALSDGPYLLGEGASLVDLYLWMLTQWHTDLDGLMARCPKIVRLVETVMARPKIAPLHHDLFGPGIGVS